jgi:hypothetical protein
MRKHAGIAGSIRKCMDQARGLSREHGEHLALEVGIAKCHALKMGAVDRAIIGYERWRWHPVNPIQVKRHGDVPKPSCARGDPARKVRSANIEKVKGRFGSNRRKFALFSAKSRRN